MPRFTPRMQERVLFALLNRAVMLRLRPCDVFICMSGYYLEAARFAKQRYGAAIWLERGSHHIHSQDEILAAIPGAQRPSPLAIRRELAGYALADRVVIPSYHVGESFRRDESAYTKLFYNPYGVDLAMFPLCSEKAPTDEALLTSLCWNLVPAKRLRSLGRGSQKEPWGATYPCRPGWRFGFSDRRRPVPSLDPAPQPELARFYAAADVFVLASREDGFGMVLAQALASGLPLICTDRTGGADLAHTPALAARITLVPHDDAGALACAIAKWRDRWRAGERLPLLPETDREKLSWAAYARRYSDELLARSFL